MHAPYVTASELADFIYCECCWADKLEGPSQETAEMIAGSEEHNRLHAQYRLIEFLRQVALIVVIGSVGVLLIFGVLYYFFIR